MHTPNSQNFSPKKGAVAVNAADAPPALRDARQRIVAALQRRALGEAGTGDGSPAPAAPSGGALFVHWERHLATRMGLSMDTVRGLREKHLQEGSDYGKQGRGRIMYSEKGAARLREVAKVPPPTSGEKVALEQQQEADAVVLIVWRKCPNAHIVLCHAPDKDPSNVGNRVRLWVKNNRHFRQGMEVKGRHMQDDLFEMLPSDAQFRKGVW